MAAMQTKFSEDVIPLTDLKVNPGRVVNQVKETHRPVLLTSRGRGVAVVQDLEEYEKDREELAFVKAVAQGLMDIKQGNTMSMSEVKKRLGIK
ncbi:MAG: type II toxin-antitoxin system Phd/YefM family antitoxin [Pseudomonadales bacterium]|nr:type II toxin-antitoxin system Phd/YefM family antitoxin [Pseudomonadales bacterium]